MVTLTCEDAGGVTVSCTFNLHIERDPCYTYRYTYTNSGNVVTSVAYPNCDGESVVTSFVDNQSPPMQNIVCAPNNTTALTNVGFVKDNNPGFPCN